MCTHPYIALGPSPTAHPTGYSRPTAAQLAAAATLESAKKIAQRSSNLYTEDLDRSSTFPGPLVLPGDELYEDPDYPPQSLRSWLRHVDFHKSNETRSKIYIAGPPRVSKQAAFVRDWTGPKVTTDRRRVTRPSVNDVAGYLRAFYHGLEVVIMPRSTFSFTTWGDKDEANPAYIGLNTCEESIGIRTRPGHDDNYSRQMNLDDLLDVAIAVLPDDAIALLMLVDHDIYETEDDDFACGRAYGGSHVSVVSTARYHPGLDQVQGIDRNHSWPASHCDTFVKDYCAEHGDSSSGKTPTSNYSSMIANTKTTEAESSPMQAALAAQSGAVPSSVVFLNSLWLSRVCRTASHELGHCFVMDHCIYYACIMQGSVSLPEDSRQPPYLCPVDLAKILRVTKTSEISREQAILGFCESQRRGGAFVAFEAWLGARIRQLSSRDTIIIVLD